MLNDRYIFRSKSDNPLYWLLSKLTVDVDIYDNIPLGYMFIIQVRCSWSVYAFGWEGLDTFWNCQTFLCNQGTSCVCVCLCIHVQAHLCISIYSPNSLLTTLSIEIITCRSWIWLHSRTKNLYFGFIRGLKIWISEQVSYSQKLVYLLLLSRGMCLLTRFGFGNSHIKNQLETIHQRHHIMITAVSTFLHNHIL